MKIKRRQFIAGNIPGSYDLYVGVDNGVSGTIGIICVGQDKVVTDFFKTPTVSVVDFQKAKKNVTRIVTGQLAAKLFPYFGYCVKKAYVMMERPMLNPRMFTSTVSAARAHEATLIVMDSIIRKCGNIEFEFVDSKGWQKDQLPAGTKGSVQLKLRSMQYGCRLFPEHAELITKHKDADGLLIANYCRGQNS
jgi:hypothetical protein